MNCKHCNAELADDVTVCPECGHDNAAKQKLSGGKITLLVILAVLVVAIVAAMVVGGLNSSEPEETTGISESTSADETVAVEATLPVGTGENDITCKGSYTVTDEEMIAAADTVVATMGDAQLTNADLQVFYWMQVYDFLETCGSYASLLGLDYTAGFDTQLSMEGDITWQQYFLDGAIGTWKNYEAMRLAAADAGYKLDSEYADYLEALPEMLESSAASYGFETALEMIQADMGVGADVDAYQNYMECYYIGYLYYSYALDSISITDEDVEAYFDANAEAYLANGLEKDDSTYVDVRHILLMPTGGTADDSGNTVYSDEEWEACKQSAEAILNEWLSGEKTEESFAELANTYSEDGGSNTNGGLYTDVYEGEMVEAFNDWCFDESRKYGDYAIVQTEFGYHIMYFVNSEYIWYNTAWNDLLTERGNEILENAMNAYPVEIDYSAIVLGDVSLVSSS